MDEALRRFGGTAWLRSPDIEVLQPVTTAVPAGVRFATKRTWLAIAAAFALLAALSPLLALAAAPTLDQVVCIVLVSTIWLGPALVLAIAAWYPAELLVHRAGITFRRGRNRAITLQWSDVDYIGVCRWNRRSWAPRFLCIRAPGLGSAPLWRRQLGFAPDVLVCDLLSLGTTGAKISAVVPEYAGRTWSPSWIPETKLVTTGDRTIIDGKAVSRRTLVAAAAAAGTLVLIFLYSAAPMNNGLFTMAAIMNSIALLAAIVLSMLLVRSPCALTVDPVAVSITMGRRTERIEWQDISHARVAQHDTINLNKRGRPDEVKTVHLIELELVQDVQMPRAWSFTPCFRQRSEVIVFCPIDADRFALNASVDAVEAELARCAGPKRWKPRVRHEYR